MKKQQVILGVCSLGIGCSILLVSLSSTARAATAATPSQTSAKKFYLGATIRPDHLLFPMVNLTERVEAMALKDPQNQVSLRLDDISQRLADSRYLLDRGEEALAVSTLQKAHLELMNTAQLVRSDPEYLASTAAVKDSLTVFRAELYEVTPVCSPEFQPQLNRLLQETDAVLTSLPQ